MINGTLQQPTVAYTVAGNLITFSETPLTSDVIEVRSIGTTGSYVQGLHGGSTYVVLNNGNVNVTAGNIVPDTDSLNDIGASGYRWRNLYVGNIQSPTIVGPTITGTANTNISSAAVATTIDTFDKTVYRTAKYIIQATHNSDYESSEVLVVHNGTTAYRTVYGVVTTSNTLGNISVTISSNNVLLQYTADNSNTVIGMSKTYLAI